MFFFKRFALNPRWAETGERYLLKLFRDYVFHQVNENGTAVIDLAHVIDTLNKLDAGSMEKIVLVGRNEKTICVVTYKDLRRALENTFKELQRGKPPYPLY